MFKLTVKEFNIFFSDQSLLRSYYVHETNIYVERRNILKNKFDSGVLLFLGNEETPANYTANTYAFRQDSSFLYYFGIDRAGFAAIIDIDNNLETLLFAFRLPRAFRAPR